MATFAQIHTICIVRNGNEMACRNCIYQGEQCEEFKARFKVDKPSDIDYLTSLKFRRNQDGTFK